MGLSYLKGLSWKDVTREERFFCAHLHNLMQQEGVSKFVSYLNNKHGTSLPVEANWEVAYEACFYRDLWHYRGKEGKPFSPKRTFDLCILSDVAINVIEAKSHQKFESEQLKHF
jgi:hypothetical protein